MMRTTDNGVPPNPATDFRDRGWKGWANSLGTPGLGEIDQNVPATVLAAMMPVLGEFEAEALRGAAYLPSDLRTAKPLLREFTGDFYLTMLSRFYADPRAWWELNVLLECLDHFVPEKDAIEDFTPDLIEIWVAATQVWITGAVRAN